MERAFLKALKGGKVQASGYRRAGFVHLGLMPLHDRFSTSICRGSWPRGAWTSCSPRTLGHRWVACVCLVHLPARWWRHCTFVPDQRSEEDRHEGGRPEEIRPGEGLRLFGFARVRVHIAGLGALWCCAFAVTGFFLRIARSTRPSGWMTTVRPLRAGPGGSAARSSSTSRGGCWPGTATLWLPLQRSRWSSGMQCNTRQWLRRSPLIWLLKESLL